MQSLTTCKQPEVTMLTFFTYVLAFIFVLIVFNILNKMVYATEELSRRISDLKKQLDERITDLRDHVRRTETSVFKAIDDRGGHLSDQQLKNQIQAIECELASIVKILEENIVLEKKPKPKKTKQ